MTSCIFCGKPIEEKTVICVRCAAKSHDPFYQTLAIFPYNHPVDVFGKEHLEHVIEEAVARALLIQIANDRREKQ
jgi:predicted amidophosphoribosyltransferase